MSRSSLIIQLPAEILVSIAAYLPKSSVNALSQTCKQLQAMLETSLYTRLDFNLPRSWFEISALEELLVTSPVGLKSTTALAVNISDLALDGGEILGPQDDWEYMEEDSPSARLGHDINKLGKFSYARYWKMATLFQLLIKKLPRETLKWFRWNHVTRLSCVTLALILKLHSKSLQELRLFGPFDSDTENQTRSLPQLRVLEISDADFAAATKLLTLARLTLTKIKLGHETSNALACLFPDLHPTLNQTMLTLDFWDDLQHTLEAHPIDVESDEEATDSVTKVEAMDANTKQSKVILPAVDALHLIAIDVAVLLCVADKQPSIENQTIASLNQPLIDIGKLQSLTLESCKMSDCIDSLSTCARVKGPLRLEVFILREEQIQPTFPPKLDAFFGLFQGLRKVSLLLQGQTSTLPVKKLISNHGETLKSLVIDQRLSARDSFGRSTHIRGSIDNKTETLLSCIGKGCPKLEQLGLSDFTTQKDWRHHRDTMRTRFENLRSLNFRVLPEHNLSYQDWESFHENSAMLFIRRYQMFFPRLTLIGTGYLTYKDIWLGRTSSEDNSNLERYLSPRYFYVQSVTNIRGEQQPLLTKIARGTPTGIDQYSSHTDIFQPYWID